MSRACCRRVAILWAALAGLAAGDLCRSHLNARPVRTDDEQIGVTAEFPAAYGGRPLPRKFP